MTATTAKLLFAIEAALPFVEAHVGRKMCSSSGSPAALKAILTDFNWEQERGKWIPFYSVMNTEVYRPPTSLAQIKQEIDETFVFNAPLSQDHATSCEKIQNASKALADLIIQEVPEGKERVICVNNILSCALFARHGITRRQVVLMAVAPESVPSPSPEQSPVESPVPTNPT